jgi:hypothetical protein
MDKKMNLEFISSAHASIWHSVRMLAPFAAISFCNEQFTEKSFYMGQEQFYLFMQDLYSDMFNDPDKYAVPTKPYDEYMKSEKAKKHKEKEHMVDTKECTLRNTFQQSIQFYPKYFYELGLAAESLLEDSYSLVVPEEKYDNVKGHMLLTHLKNDNEKRYEIIKNIGIRTEKAAGNYYISSERYPGMFLGLWILCKAGESACKYMNYLRIDYCGTQKASPDIETIKTTLEEGHAGIIDELRSNLSELKYKVKIKPLRNITSESKWKVEYIYQNKNILGYYADPFYFTLCIYFNNAKNITDLGRQLEKYDAKLYDWFCSKFKEKKCKCPYNRRVTFGTVDRRICGFSNRAEIENPNEYDIENSIRVLRMFRNI